MTRLRGWRSAGPRPDGRRRRVSWRGASIGDASVRSAAIGGRLGRAGGRLLGPGRAGGVKEAARSPVCGSVSRGAGEDSAAGTGRSCVGAQWWLPGCMSSRCGARPMAAPLPRGCPGVAAWPLLCPSPSRSGDLGRAAEAGGCPLAEGSALRL